MKKTKQKEPKDPSPQAPKRFEGLDDIAEGPKDPVPGRGLKSYTSNEVREALAKLAQLRAEKEQVDKEVSDLVAQIDYQQAQAVEIMNASGITNVKFDDIGHCYLSTSSKPHVLDREKLLEDLEKRGLGSIIKRDVHYQTLRGTITEIEKAGKAPLDGVEVERRPIVVIRRIGGTREGGES